MSTKIVAGKLVIIAVVAAVTVVATGGVLSVKPAYANNPDWTSCTQTPCPPLSPAASYIPNNWW